MLNDEDEPRPRPQLVPRPLLDRLGVSELEAYIEGLKAEIARAEGEIARKAGHRDAADAFFKPR